MKTIIFKTIAVAIFIIASYVSAKFYSNKNKEAGYIITLTPDNITVLDPDNGKVILTETYDSKSPLVKAILKDNE